MCRGAIEKSIFWQGAAAAISNEAEKEPETNVDVSKMFSPRLHLLIEEPGHACLILPNRKTLRYCNKRKMPEMNEYVAPKGKTLRGLTRLGWHGPMAVVMTDGTVYQPEPGGATWRQPIPRKGGGYKWVAENDVLHVVFNREGQQLQIVKGGVCLVDKMGGVHPQTIGLEDDEALHFEVKDGAIVVVTVGNNEIALPDEVMGAKPEYPLEQSAPIDYSSLPDSFHLDFNYRSTPSMRNDYRREVYPDQQPYPQYWRPILTDKDNYKIRKRTRRI